MNDRDAQREWHGVFFFFFQKYRPVATEADHAAHPSAAPGKCEHCHSLQDTLLLCLQRKQFLFILLFLVLQNVDILLHVFFYYLLHYLSVFSSSYSFLHFLSPLISSSLSSPPFCLPASSSNFCYFPLKSFLHFFLSII